MNYFKALQILRAKGPQEEILEAAKKVNEVRNRLRLLRLRAAGYSEEEAKAIIYAAP